MPVQIRQEQTLTLESAYQPVLTALERLFRLVNVGRAAEADVEMTSDLLETLPLGTSEFGFARLRLNNANDYRVANENGAAAWEVRTVLLQLRASLSAEAADPRVRNTRR